MDTKEASTRRHQGKTEPEDLNNLFQRFQSVRKTTEELCQPLEVEDYVAQPIVDVSPPKWHLAHTTWFFEELILKKHLAGYKEFNSQYGFLFNSYYESVGERTLRPDRGNMTRPTVREIMKYREYVNHCMGEFLSKEEISEEAKEVIVLGINHEQQHQELLITDLKYILGHNPVFPVYVNEKDQGQTSPGPALKTEWVSVEEGIYHVGHEGKRFCFDNERGRHKAYLHPFQIMDRLVTNGEYMEFIDEGGYENFEWWFSEAWDWVNRFEVKAPMYWHKMGGKWMQYRLSGLSEVNEREPVTHISLFEADAFAQWKNMRLPTEWEWEAAANNFANDRSEGTFLDDKRFHPATRPGNSSQFLGDVWEWTNSAYLPYPYFRKAPGAVGEYNGKFMVNQKVLRGGSCVTPRDHIRLTYRNFFHPQLRWQFNGLRLARTLG